MASCAIRPFEGGDLSAVVGLLRTCLVADAMSEPMFVRKVLLDPNFDPDGAPVAIEGDEVVGFLLAVARRRPLEDGPDDRDRGWITLFAVRQDGQRHGIGRALLERGLAYLKGRGCSTALVSPYAPGYWTPGVDVAAYPGAVTFLGRHGFGTVYRPLSMATQLVADWRAPSWVLDRRERLASEGVRVSVFGPQHLPALTAFLRAEFPGDWQRHVRETMADITLGRRSADDLLVAHDGSVVVGFSQHEGERFGPFGVAQQHRGRGIGVVLLFETLERMRRKGLQHAWFMWTDDTTAERVYAAAGFRETRRYAVMRREL